MKKDFHMDDSQGYQYNNSDDSNNELKFIKYLPKYIPFSSIEPYSKQFKEAGVVDIQKCDGSYHRFDDNIAKYIAAPILKPLIQKLFDEALQKSELDPAIIHINHPVIHFRCADVPFIKHPEYKLQKYSYFKTSLENSGYLSGPITILWYGGHRSTSEGSESCSKYAIRLKGYLEGIGYEVDIQADSNVEDFAKIFYAPISISTGGSFSMFAGLFGYGKFYQPQMFDMPVGVSADWLQSGYNIEHDKVSDYHDIETVTNILK